MQGVAWPGSAQRKRRILVWCGSVGGGVSLQCGVCGVAMQERLGRHRGHQLCPGFQWCGMGAGRVFGGTGIVW